MPQVRQAGTSRSTKQFCPLSHNSILWVWTRFNHFVHFLFTHAFVVANPSQSQYPEKFAISVKILRLTLACEPKTDNPL
jgi:hypothetical protein